MDGFEEIDFAEFADFELEIEDSFETRYIKPPRAKERGITPKKKGIKKAKGSSI